MGQKTNVNSLHLIKNKNWNSFWYSDYQNYRFIFQEDFYIYLYIRSQSNIKYQILKRKHTYNIEIVNNSIYRTHEAFILSLELAYIINKKSHIQTVKFFITCLLINLKRVFNYKKNSLLISYTIGRNNAMFVGLKLASLIEKRIKFQSKLVDSFINMVECSGIYIVSKGRLNLIDRAKQDKISIGAIPLQTIKANIDYSLIIANTKKGLQSIKVWIFFKYS